jgi:hypothetical protein
MCWAVLVTTLLGGAALSGERLLRSARRPTRGVWMAAMASSIGLQSWRLVSGGSDPGTDSGLGSTPTPSATAAWLAEALAAATPTADLAARIDAVATMAWSLSAATLTAALIGGLLVLRGRAAGWARTTVGGEDVLVSPDFGPALIGFLPPRIVLPRWALALPDRELRLACQHEVEHRRGGDGWILLAGALTVSLMPWNPALWWMLSRLRAAVEMDCDNRVIRRGASRRAYGALLLDVGLLDRSHRFPALAFARPPSLLERRLTMIVNDVRPASLPRTLVAMGIALALVIAACGTPAPTNPANPENAVLTTDATSAEGAGSADTRGGELPFSPAADLPEGSIVLVDGIRVAGLPDVQDLNPEDIERVEVYKGDDATQPTVEIFTKTGPDIYVNEARYEGDYTQIPPSDIERIDVHKFDSKTEVRITLKPGAPLPG